MRKALGDLLEHLRRRGLALASMVGRLGSRELRSEEDAPVLGPRDRRLGSRELRSEEEAQEDAPVLGSRDRRLGSREVRSDENAQEDAPVLGSPDRRQDSPSAGSASLTLIRGGRYDQAEADVRTPPAKRNWSREMLTHFAGLHSTEVARLERGLREPRLRTVLQVAEALKVPVAELIAPPDEHRPDAPATPPAEPD